MTTAVKRFQQIVNERGDDLRQLTYEQLNQLEDRPVEYVTVERRRGRITTFVERETPDGCIRVVIQGFLAGRFLPMLWSVAMDGFHRYPDEKTTPLSLQEMWEFDWSPTKRGAGCLLTIPGRARCDAHVHLPPKRKSNLPSAAKSDRITTVSAVRAIAPR